MKAAVYYANGGPEVFRYEDVPEPECGPEDVVIRVESISIEGGDLVNREIRPLARIPHIVGHQCAGTITAVGAQVRDRRIGQTVVAILHWGSHAELAAAPASDTWVLPEGMDIDQAAAMPVAWGTAHECRVVIDTVFPLSAAADAHRHVLGRTAFGRVLLRPGA